MIKLQNKGKERSEVLFSDGGALWIGRGQTVEAEGEVVLKSKDVVVSEVNSPSKASQTASSDTKSESKE